MEKGSSFHLYKDIAERTDGDVYIGVVGLGADGEEHLHCPLHGGAGFAPHGPWPQAGPAAG